MITLIHKKQLQLPFSKGCRVKAIANTKWYKIGAVGIVENVIKISGAEDSLLIGFVGGNFDPASNWFGSKRDFIMIK